MTFPINGQITSSNKLYPVDLPVSGVATITLTKLTGDLDIHLLKDGHPVAWSERDGLQDEEIIYTVEGPGQYTVQVRPYGPQPGATFTLDVQVAQAPVQPVLFHAAIITRDAGYADAEAWASKLSNMQSADRLPIAIATTVTRQYQTYSHPASLAAMNLIIIGHDTDWGNAPVDKALVSWLAQKPLLLMGQGGRQFLYALDPVLTGIIAQTIGKSGGPFLEWDNPLYKYPYPLSWQADQMAFYPDYQVEYAAAQTGIEDITPILVNYWLSHTAFKVGDRIAYWGYPAVAPTWQVWGCFANIAMSLAAQK